MNSLYKIFIFAGLVFILIGVSLFIFQKLNIPLGKLPGDIIIKKGNFSFYFPVVTSIVVSFILTMIFHLFRK